MGGWQGNKVTDLKHRSTHVKSQDNEEEEKVISRKQLHDFLISERDRVRNCNTLPMTLMVWILFVVGIWFHGRTWSMNLLQGVIRDSIEGIQVPYALSDFDKPATRSLSVGNLSTIDEVWTWLGKGFIPFFAGTPEEPAVVRIFNQVVGPGVVLRQRRVQGSTCPVSEDLKDFFRQDCRSDVASRQSFGPQATANSMNTSSDNAFIAGGGYQISALPLAIDPKDMFYAFLDVSFLRSWANGTNSIVGIKGVSRLSQLQRWNWMDEATDYVEAKVTLFNPEIVSFTQITVIVQVVKGGLVQTSLSVRPFPAQLYQSGGFVIIDVVWAILLSLIFFSNLQEVYDRKGLAIGDRCCGTFWLLTDWLLILVGVFLIAFFVVLGLGMQTLDPDVASLGVAISQVPVEPPPTIQSFQQAAYDRLQAEKAFNTYGRLASFQGEMDLLITVRTYHQLGMFWFLAFLLVRFFRGFAGQPRIAGIGRTLSQAGPDLLHLLLMCAVLFINLAFGGYILFGFRLEEWSSLTKASTSTLCVLFGQVNLQAMYQFAPVSTLIWMIGYLIFAIVLLWHLLVAILVEHHIEVRQSAGRSPVSVPYQAWMSASDFVWKWSYNIRVLIRFIKSRCMPGGKIDRMLPNLKPEPKRIPKVPYDELIAFFATDDALALTPQRQSQGSKVSVDQLPSWTPVTHDALLLLGIDVATAERLLRNCRACTSKLHTEELPIGQLFEEFEAVMSTAYHEIDAIGDDLKNWVSERRVDSVNMEPKQKKLEHLSRNIKPAEPLVGFELPPMLEEPDFEGESTGGGSQFLALRNT